MRRRRTRREQLSVSLFPFLAVLICTFGVLIVMLVMAVKSADDQAQKTQADQDQQHQDKLDEVQSVVEIHAAQMEGLQAMRPSVVARMQQSQANRSYLEDTIRQLKKKFKRVGEELVELEQPLEFNPTEISEFSEQEAAEEIASRKKALAQAISDLQSKREIADQVGPAVYVIVPYNGGGGTFRRPIFLECTADAITLQPSGIRLDKNEFLQPLEPGNMLDSALLAVREYWNRYDLAGKEGSPYPLIVVRPDGAETFVLARRAMKSWDNEFGYELVEADKTLDFGTRDPQLESELKDTIGEARRRQQVRRRHMARQTVSRFDGQPEPGGLTASGTHGGFVSTAGGRGGSESGGSESRGSAHSRDPMVAPASGQQNAQSNDWPPSQTANQQSNSGATSAGSTGGADSSATTSGTGGDGKVQNPYADLSLAKQRGSNWALPSQTPGATAYLRPIRIICGPDHLEVRAVSGQVKRIPISGATSGSIDPLIDEVWRQIDGWGLSGADGYWKPQLRFTVLDGGQTRFQELRGLLYQSGLGVEGAR